MWRMRLRLAEVGEENDNMMANVVDVEIVYIKHIICGSNTSTVIWFNRLQCVNACIKGTVVGALNSVRVQRDVRSQSTVDSLNKNIIIPNETS